VSRSHYTDQSRARASRRAALLPAFAVLAGCTMSVVGPEEPPATTGSLAPPVHVREPLPPTLAYSDAAKIGEAASAVLWQAAAPASPAEWMNAATGSSGTLEQQAALDAGSSANDCRTFDTIVTSIGGVHRYSGSVCRQGGGRSVVQIEEPRPAEPRGDAAAAAETSADETI
jgi:hypothetical protein